MKAEHVGRRRTTKKQRQPKAVAGALQELVEGLGIRKVLSGYSVVTSWEAIVGEQIARVAQAERVEGGVLIVKVASAPWRNELSMRRQEIMDKIVETVGKGIIREIRFR